MLKKNGLLITLILVSLLLISCQANTPAPTPSPTPGQTASPAPGESPSPSPTSDAAAYEITGDTYAEGDIVIQYPQITGLSDTARQEQINILIKDDATAIVEEGGTVDVGYTVTWTGPHLLSIQYSGLRSFEGSAYPNNLFYTTNVDIDSAAKIRLDDVITIDDGFIETFQDGAFVPWDSGYGEAEDIIRETVDGYDLTQALTAGDNGYGTDNPDYCFSYFTDEALGISIGVPHAIGDHAEFEIGYQDLQGLTKQHAIWDDFSSELAGDAPSEASIDDIYGDWVVSSHLASNPQGSTYSQEAIEDMIGLELTYAEDRAFFKGEILDNPYYQTATVTQDEFEADYSMTFEELGIDSTAVTDVTVYMDPQYQNVWMIPASFIFIDDQDRLIIRGDGEFFELSRE